MDVIVSGITTANKEEQPLKALSPMNVRFSGSVIVDRDVQFKNEFLSIDSILSGNRIEASVVLPEKKVPIWVIS